MLAAALCTLTFVAQEEGPHHRLRDGRAFSSDVHTAAYAQPPTWAYAEGNGVPFGEEITADVRFGLAE